MGAALYRTVFQDEDGTQWIGAYVDSRERADRVAVITAAGNACKPVYRLKVRPWIPHDGGPCPVEGDTMVRCRLSDGWLDDVHAPARFWHWPHTMRYSGDHIIAYQIMEDA